MKENIVEIVNKGKLGFSKGIKIPAVVGLSIGFLAAFVQALIISAGGPEAYGFCVACHTRDFTNAIVNAFTGQSLGIAPVAGTAISLTFIGVILGGYLSAKKYKEFKVKKGKPLMYIIYLIGGIAVMNFSLLLGACPYRAALRFAYGDMIALIGIVSIAGGVAVGVVLLKYYMNKGGI